MDVKSKAFCLSVILPNHLAHFTYKPLKIGVKTRLEDTQMKEKRVAEGVWLDYFNRYLLENGVITEREYAQMSEKIAERDRSKSRK